MTEHVLTKLAAELDGAFDRYLSKEMSPDDFSDLLWENKAGIIAAMKKLAAQQDAREDEATIVQQQIADNVRVTTIEECAKVKVELRGFGGRSDEYLKGFEDACHSYIKSIRKLKGAVEQTPASD